MKTYYVVLLLVFAATNSIVRSAEGQPASGLRITLSMPKDRYILGEPIVFVQTWEALGSQPAVIAFTPEPETPATQVLLSGPVNTRCARHQSRKWIALAHTSLEGKNEKPLDVTWLGVVNEGEYDLQLIYDSTGLPKDYAQVGVQPVHIESNRVHFRVEAPSGVDAQAFKRFRETPPSTGVPSDGYAVGECNKIRLGEELLKEFPTSTYAAYYLFTKAQPGYPPGYDPPDHAAEDEYMAIDKDRSSGSAGPVFDTFWNNQRQALAALEQLHSQFPTFAYRPEVLYGLVRMYFRVGEAAKAVPVLQELFAKHGSARAAIKAQAYKQLLQDRGMWSDQSQVSKKGSVEP